MEGSLLTDWMNPMRSGWEDSRIRPLLNALRKGSSPGRMLTAILVFGALLGISPARSFSNTTATSDATSDFERRCNVPGVIRCFAFDDPKAADSHVRAPWGELRKR